MKTQFSVLIVSILILFTCTYAAIQRAIQLHEVVAKQGGTRIALKTEQTGAWR